MIKTREKLTVQFIGNRWVQNCDTRFRETADVTSVTLVGSSISRKEATKLGSNIAKKSEHVPLYIRSFQGQTGVNVIALELRSHVDIPMQMERIPGLPRMLS